jgi:hypothetical protein
MPAMTRMTIARMMKVRDLPGARSGGGRPTVGSVFMTLNLKLGPTILKQGFVACQIQI